MLRIFWPETHDYHGTVDLATEESRWCRNGVQMAKRHAKAIPERQ